MNRPRSTHKSPPRNLSFFKHNPYNPPHRAICPSLHAKNRDTANRFPVVVIVFVPSVGSASTSGIVVDRPPLSLLPLPPWNGRSFRETTTTTFYPVNEVPRHGDRRWAIIVARTTDRSVDRSSSLVSPLLLRGPRSATLLPRR